MKKVMLMIVAGLFSSTILLAQTQQTKTVEKKTTKTETVQPVEKKEAAKPVEKKKEAAKPVEKKKAVKPAEKKEAAKPADVKTEPVKK